MKTRQSLAIDEDIAAADANKNKDKRKVKEMRPPPTYQNVRYTGVYSKNKKK
jgi:hypothetical protein